MCSCASVDQAVGGGAGETASASAVNEGIFLARPSLSFTLTLQPLGLDGFLGGVPLVQNCWVSIFWKVYDLAPLLAENHGTQ